jgi:signal transduction histidine kinase
MRRAEFFLSLYLNRLRKQLQADIPGASVVVARVMPTELWIRTAQVPDRWFVLRWQVARPETPFAMGGVVLAGGLQSLVAAAVFARRLTAPLATLVEATRRVGEGEVVAVDASSGPSEVRSLAVAFQAMSQRLVELDERRELMLAGLSHDLRSPLARMRVAVDLLESSHPGLIGQITTDVEEIDRIVGQFLHYVRAGYRETPARASADEIAWMRAGNCPHVAAAGRIADQCRRPWSGNFGARMAGGGPPLSSAARRSGGRALRIRSGDRRAAGPCSPRNTRGQADSGWLRG